jgi:hypothetical protein
VIFALLFAAIVGLGWGVLAFLGALCVLVVFFWLSDALHRRFRPQSAVDRVSYWLGRPEPLREPALPPQIARSAEELDNVYEFSPPVGRSRFS